MSDLFKAIANILRASVESKLEYLFKNNHKTVVAFLEKLAKCSPHSSININGNAGDFIMLAKGFITDYFPFKDATGNYTSWTLLKLATDDNLLIEDVEFKIGETLKKFDELKTKVQNKSVKIEGFRSDINSFKTFNELEDYIDSILQDSSALARSYGILERPEALELFAKKDAEITYRGGTVTVVRLDTFAASEYFSAGTKWCTSDAGMFRNYTGSQPRERLHVVLCGKEKYQFSFKENQYMDARDRPLKLESFLKENPEVLKAFSNWSIAFWDFPNDEQLITFIMLGNTISAELFKVDKIEYILKMFKPADRKSVV